MNFRLRYIFQPQTVFQVQLIELRAFFQPLPQSKNIEQHYLPSYDAWPSSMQYRFIFTVDASKISFKQEKGIQMK